MKKVAIVLLMGLAIGMTFMSCSKEEMAAEEVVENCAYKIQSLEMSTNLDTGVVVYYASVRSTYGDETIVVISYNEYVDYSYDLMRGVEVCWSSN